MNHQKPLTEVYNLPSQVTIVKDRKAFIVDYCRGKNVLYLGCVGSGYVEERLKDKSHLY